MLTNITYLNQTFFEIKRKPPKLTQKVIDNMNSPIFMKEI